MWWNAAARCKELGVSADADVEHLGLGEGFGGRQALPGSACLPALFEKDLEPRIVIGI